MLIFQLCILEPSHVPMLLAVAEHTLSRFLRPFGSHFCRLIRHPGIDPLKRIYSLVFLSFSPSHRLDWCQLALAQEADGPPPRGARRMPTGGAHICARIPAGNAHF